VRVYIYNSKYITKAPTIYIICKHIYRYISLYKKW